MPTGRKAIEEYRARTGESGGSGIYVPGVNAATEAVPDLDFEVGGDNQEFLGEEYTDFTDWADNLATQIGRELVAAGEAAGQDKFTMMQFLSANLPTLLQDIDRELFQGNATSAFGRQYNAFDEQFAKLGQPVGFDFYAKTLQGFNNMSDYARNWFQLKMPSLRDTWENGAGGASARSSSGGGGPRLPTEAEIRQQFDLDQLAAQAQNIWRGTLLEELDDPRGLARRYVDAVVAGRGEQKIDFNTWVDKRTEETARSASIYKNKPESMSKAQFITPYLNNAQQVMGATDEAAGVAIGGAQFGASGQSFQERLKRTDQVTGSAPFINQLEARMGDLRKVFKG